jgi:hypothetical protein
VRIAPLLLAGFGLMLLAGCQSLEEITLEQAKADCDQKGGQLVIYYSQQITRTSVDRVVQTPGACITNDVFMKPGNKPEAPPAAAPPAAEP